ncbi:hypothetical protein HII31_11960 [Pseudocercospora fuligena]|uniref:C2H2-type domain-containing protein n=1 Tax=Pseudocercospora fuligena TaxID=685502 RepID=A0A8H6R912_9PEZI|nr:hypothetical protein HII31_11960 [Pseudocercospora fuligena]
MGSAAVGAKALQNHTHGGLFRSCVVAVSWRGIAWTLANDSMLRLQHSCALSAKRRPRVSYPAQDLGIVRLRIAQGDFFLQLYSCINTSRIIHTTNSAPSSFSFLDQEFLAITMERTGDLLQDDFSFLQDPSLLYWPLDSEATVVPLDQVELSGLDFDSIQPEIGNNVMLQTYDAIFQASPEDVMFPGPVTPQHYDWESSNLFQNYAGVDTSQLLEGHASSIPTSAAMICPLDCFEPDLWSEYGAATSNARWFPVERQNNSSGSDERTLPQWMQYSLGSEVTADQRVPAPDTNSTLQRDTGSDIMVCLTADSIPPGRQPTKRLLCGHPGCTSLKLFDRKYELERHMATHLDGAFKCPVEGCPRKDEAFKRKEHLKNHLWKLHGRC